MKPVQIVLLVIAGALSGVVITKVWQRPRAVPVSARVAAPVETVPQSVPPAPAVEPAATPVQTEKPSPAAPSATTERTPSDAAYSESPRPLKRREAPAVAQRR